MPVRGKWMYHQWIGERAGNASLEEIAMGLRTRKDFYQADTQIQTEEISKSSRLVSNITGMVVQPNKAISGCQCICPYVWDPSRRLA